jgi:hypothetical protein
MLKLDILSNFLKLNYVYQKMYNITGTALSSRILCKIFDINDLEFDQYEVRLEHYFSVITYPHWDDFDELMLFLTLVELKNRISNFQRRHGRFKVEKILDA